MRSLERATIHKVLNSQWRVTLVLVFWEPPGSSQDQKSAKEAIRRNRHLGSEVGGDISKQELRQVSPEHVIRFVVRWFFAVQSRRSVQLLEIECGPGANVWFMAREDFR